MIKVIFFQLINIILYVRDTYQKIKPMKDFIFIIFLIVFLVSQAQIPNSSFESWESFGNYENPTSWDTPNDLTSSLGKIVVSKESSIVYDGNYSIKITVVSSLFGNLPGMATLGDFSFNMTTMSPNITGGIPFTQRPLKLKGYYQYEPNTPDNALIGIFLLKENGSSYDTISADGFEPGSTVLSWTPFEIPITYRSNDIPTHLNIILMPTNRISPKNGSTLYVDKLELVFPSTHIQEDYLQSLKVYSVKSYIYVEHNEKSSFEVEIYDVLGHLVHQQKVEKKLEIIDLSSCKGLYIVKVKSISVSKTFKIILS